MAVTFTDRQLYKRAIVGLLGSMGLSDAIAMGAQASSDYFSFAIASDDAMASTATSETRTNIYLKRACLLKSVAYVATTGGITADATDNAVVTLSKRDSAGANLTTVATLTTNVALGDVVQDAAVQMTLTAAAVAITAGSTLTYSIAKGGSGVVFRAGVFMVEVEWD